MKTTHSALRLFIVRHAKSSWKDLKLQDHDRPLNKRGIDNAPRMGQYLKQLPIPQVDLMISSTAKRAVDTANFLSEALKPKRIERSVDIYMANLPTLLCVLTKAPKAEEKTLMLVGHNPELTSLANHIASAKNVTTPISNVPTCAVLDIAITSTHWKNLTYKDMQLQGFYCPKLCFD